MHQGSSSHAAWQVRVRRARALGFGVLAGGLLIAGVGPGVSPAAGAPTSMVDLGQASTYAAISGASVGNTVSAPDTPHTTLRGDLGVKANAQPTGFPPGVVTGATNVGNLAAAQAHAALVAAYGEVAARTGGDPLAGALAGETITPGLHTIAAAASNTGTVTLDAEDDPNAVFVFQVNGALAMAAGSHVVLSRGARASRVFWQVNGAGAIGANADFAGTLMALDAVAVGHGSLVNGRAFARNGALTLDADEVYSAPPVITITGGATAYTTDTTPTISGTTDIEAPGVVTLTINGQELTATPSGGIWSVTSAILANATYPVAASVVDGAGNPGSASQQLTVDTVLPLVTIDGGPSVTTNDPTPTLTGTSDVAPGTVVRVSIGAQARTALVQSDGTWNLTPGTLTDGTRNVTASVTDPAGNDGTTGQLLIVDTTPPSVTITGGANAVTSDPAPVISGTADVAAGSIVTVSIAGRTTTTLVRADGTWSATSAAVGQGMWPVVASATDPAGNVGTAGQTLTIAVAAPVPPAPAPIAPPTAPIPGSAPSPAPDAVARTTITRSGRQKVRSSSLSIATKVTASIRGAVVASVTGSVKIVGARRSRRLTRAVARIATSRSATVRLRPTGTRKAAAAVCRTISRAARRGTKVTATITVRLSDAFGHTRVVRRSVRLTG